MKRSRLALALLTGLALASCKPADASGASGDERPAGGHGLSYEVVGEGDGPWVVVLHGYGAAGDDLAPLARRIASATGARCAVVAAPLSTGGGGRAWWPLDVARLRAERARGVNAFAEREPAGRADARRRVVSLVASLRSEPGGARPVYLVGFSQGAMLAADVALHLEPPPAGVAVLSGTFVTVDEWTARMAERPDVAVLVAHGRDDAVLPFEWAESLAAAWSSHARSVRFLPFDGGHGIPREVVDAVVELVRRGRASRRRSCRRRTARRSTRG